MLSRVRFSVPNILAVEEQMAENNATICRLPTEIFTEIFLYVSISTQEYFLPRVYCAGITPGPYSWLPSITHVCRQWRTAALRTHILWRRIFTLRFLCVKEILKRSQKAPLLVYAGFGKSSNRTIGASLKAILKEMPRIEGIHFEFSPDLYDKISAFAGLPTPRLRVFISASPFNLEHMPEFPFGFGHALPLLEHLDLSKYPRHAIQSMLRPTLKRLRLYNSEPQLIREDFIDALKALPLLTHLLLHNAIIQDDHSISSNLVPFRSILDIPRLQSLEIVDNRSGSASFLDAISFPPTTTTRYALKFTDEQATISWLHALRNKLNLRDSSTPAISFQSLTMSHEDSRGCGELYIGAWPTIVETVPMYKYLDKYPFNLGYRCTLDLLSTMKKVFIVQVFKTLGFRDIRNLNISGSDLRTTVWASLVGEMPNVERLFIEGHSKPNLLAVMSLGSRDETTKDIAGVITAFPKLKSLNIQFPSYVSQGESRSDVLERLVRDLELRRAGGLELESLRVQNGKGAKGETVERLRAVVHHLTWTQMKKSENKSGVL